ncbi:23S rRNA (uracil(1939)-C(5))-methyltransferase [hydrothermal vent metagenome]|uniref:23S rRNA (Uracil(1939)-C(5))-methyltransferase n=1 Tax=hydrothermal vent metagenome TaxID=652676 RepID=A0A3B1B807_9ZZZZ
MSRKQRYKKPDPTPVQTSIESLTHEGRGVARIEGKTVFIDDALAGEVVEFIYTRKKRDFDEARLHRIITPSEHRVEPACAHFGVCGGCRLQHLDPGEQLRVKENVLLDNFRRVGKVETETLLAPLSGSQWGYRRKARLGVRYVHKKGRVLVGFRERGSSFLSELDSCKVLHPLVGEKLLLLSEVIRKLSIYRQIPQIEVAVADNSTALIFRNLEELTDEDKNILIEFGKIHNFQIYQQPKGPDTVSLLSSEQDKTELYYELHDQNLKIHFEPADFTQVNHDINTKMVRRALELLQLDKNDILLELFCGLGNFTLPMAQQAKKIVAVEGDAGLIQRARENAIANGMDNVEYQVANLMENLDNMPWLKKDRYDKVLLDPPRSGAKEVLPYIAATAAKRIVYVSCHPGTLARDAGELVHEYGYRLRAAGVMDMFPHTAHVESIALFEKSSA